MNLLWPSRSRSLTSKKTTPSRSTARSPSRSIVRLCRSKATAQGAAPRWAISASPRGERCSSSGISSGTSPGSDAASITSPNWVAGSLRAHGRFGRLRMRAVDDVAPMNQLGKRAHIEAEFCAGHVRQQFRAGLGGGVVKLVAGAVGSEMLGVGGIEESALVMVEPPGDAGRNWNR